jgi:hypothetical protein
LTLLLAFSACSGNSQQSVTGGSISDAKFNAAFDFGKAHAGDPGGCPLFDEAAVSAIPFLKEHPYRTLEASSDDSDHNTRVVECSASSGVAPDFGNKLWNVDLAVGDITTDKHAVASKTIVGYEVVVTSEKHSDGTPEIDEQSANLLINAVASHMSG